jgi:hypothetical protein
MLKVQPLKFILYSQCFKLRAPGLKEIMSATLYPKINITHLDPEIGNQKRKSRTHPISFLLTIGAIEKELLFLPYV